MVTLYVLASWSGRDWVGWIELGWALLGNFYWMKVALTPHTQMHRQKTKKKINSIRVINSKHTLTHAEITHDFHEMNREPEASASPTSFRGTIKTRCASSLRLLPPHLMTSKVWRRKHGRQQQERKCFSRPPPSLIPWETMIYACFFYLCFFWLDTPAEARENWMENTWIRAYFFYPTKTDNTRRVSRALSMAMIRALSFDYVGFVRLLELPVFL